MNFWENIVDSCRPPSMEVWWSIQQTLATKIGGATPKNTKMQPLQKRWQKSDKMNCWIVKSPELLRKHHGFMSHLAHGSSLIHSANSSDQNRWSNTKKHTNAAFSEKMAKKWQNELFDREVTWTFEKILWIHVAHRARKFTDLFSKLWRPKLVEQHQKMHNCSLFRKDGKKVTKWIVWSWNHLSFWENITDSSRPLRTEASWSIQQTLETKIGGATPKNTQLQPLQKRLQKSDKMNCLIMKSPELLRKHHGFVSPIAHGSSLIYSANSRDQNRWSKTEKHTNAVSSEDIAKNWQNNCFVHEVTWNFAEIHLIHVAHRPKMLPDLFSKL